MKNKTWAVLCAAALTGALAQAADLSVTVTNVASAEGQVLVALFDKASAFPREVARGQAVPAGQRDAQGALRVVFAGLPVGTYAVSAVHDRDGDGKLNRNVMGVPTEPFGFSGRPSGRFGPPDFQEAAMELPAAGLDITIPVR